MKKILLSLVTVFACMCANAQTFQVYTDEITEGDYVITDATADEAMVAKISSNRFGYVVYSTTGATAENIWHIAPIAGTNYYSIYNKATESYAAGNGTKNQGALAQDATKENAQWEITMSNGTFEFVNVGNKAKNVNKNLRCNGTYGFACYSTSTGKPLTLYKAVAAGEIAAPKFSPMGGTYYSAQTVALSAADGDIYYSTDGTFKKYTEAIPVNATTTIKAYALVGDKKSDEVSQTYVIADMYETLEDLAKVTPNNNPVAVSVKDLEITSIYVTSKGNRNGLYFTLADGKKVEMFDYDVPAEWVEGGTVTGKLYGIWKDYNGTWEIDGTNTSFDYATDLTYTAPAGAIALPTITPAAGTYTEAQTVTITATEGCGIVYTLDGTTPVYGAGTLVENNTVTFTVKSTTTIKAIAYDLNDEDICSPVASVKITIQEKKDLTPISYSELTNTSFENWTNGKPDQWVANSTASNATISQSDVARTGTYGVKMNGTSSNTRLASTEIKFPAGYYTMTVYVYGMAETSKVRPGYVPVVLDNNAYKVGTYVYFTDAENAPKDTWTEVKHTFKLDTENIVSLVVMNPKNSGNLVVDDVEIRTATQEEQEAFEIATAISNTKVNATATGKFVENGKLVIVKGGKKYNAVGIDM